MLGEYHKKNACITVKMSATKFGRHLLIQPVYRPGYKVHTVVLRHLAGSGNQKGVESATDKPETQSTSASRPGMFGFISRFIPGGWANGGQEHLKSTGSVKEGLKHDHNVKHRKNKGSQVFSEEFLEVCDRYGLSREQLENPKSVTRFLKKVHQKLKPGESIYKSVKREEQNVIDELFETLQKLLTIGENVASTDQTNSAVEKDGIEIKKDYLGDTELLELLKTMLCYSDIPYNIRTLINDRTAESLNSEVYTVEQLLEVIKELVPVGLPDNETFLQSLLMHISNSKRQLLDHKSLVSVINLFPKEMQSHFVADAENLLSQLNFNEIFKFTKKAGKDAVTLEMKWAKLYTQGKIDAEINPSDIEIILSEYLSSGYISPGCIKVIDKMVHDLCESPDNCLQLDPRTICCSLSYFTFVKHFSEHLLQLSCQHYVVNVEKYSPEQVAEMVIALGTVNYQPPVDIQTQFFKNVSNTVSLFFFDSKVKD